MKETTHDKINETGLLIELCLLTIFKFPIHYIVGVGLVLIYYKIHIETKRGL